MDVDESINPVSLVNPPVHLRQNLRSPFWVFDVVDERPCLFRFVLLHHPAHKNIKFGFYPFHHLLMLIQPPHNARQEDHLLVW